MLAPLLLDVRAFPLAEGMLVPALAPLVLDARADPLVEGILVLVLAPQGASYAEATLAHPGLQRPST